MTGRQGLLFEYKKIIKNGFLQKFLYFFTIEMGEMYASCCLSGFV